MFVNSPSSGSIEHTVFIQFEIFGMNISVFLLFLLENDKNLRRRVFAAFSFFQMLLDKSYKDFWQCIKLRSLFKTKPSDRFSLYAPLISVHFMQNFHSNMRLHPLHWCRNSNPLPSGNMLHQLEITTCNVHLEHSQ